MPRPLIENRRTAILDAAEALILEAGFDEMTVASVALRAGIAKGAVYREFESKRAVLDAVLRRGFARVDEAVRSEIGDEPRVSQAYRATVSAVLDDPLVTAAFLDDRSVLGAHVSESADARYRDRHLGVVDWFRTLQARGALGAVDPEALALALSSATIGLLSAGRLIGPVDAAQFAGALDVLAQMVETFEPE